MKKRVFGILLVVMAVILTFSLVGCDPDDNEPSPTTYTVTYSAGEGEGTPPTGGEFAEGATVTLPQATGLTKNGYHFTAWNDGTTNYEAGATYTMPAKAVTFTAQWEEDEQPIMYTVTFNPNNDQATWTSEVENGNPVAKPATDPTIESGKHFRYWMTEDGEIYSFDTPVTANITLYAKYEYKVTFEAGEGEGTVEPMWKGAWTTEGIILPDGTGLTHNEGKVFDGWSDGTNTYQAGDRFVGEGNHTLTAVWKTPLPDITISFSTTFYAEGDAPSSITGKHAGDDVTLPQNTFTAKADRVGYVFKGWYVQGGDNSVLYQPGETYTIPTDFAGEMLVFMAKWDKGDFTITYKAGDHATGDDIVKNVKGGPNYLLNITETSFTPELNYIFNGWKKEGGTEDNVFGTSDSYSVGENTVFVAQWLHVYSAFDNANTAEIGLYLDMGTGYLYIYGAAEDGSEDVLVNLTFTLSDTAIAITLEGGTPVNGTFDDNGLAIALTYDGTTYTFGQVTPPVTDITISFATTFYAEGDAPVSITGKHAGDDVTLPQNTFTAKADRVGYVFKGWYVQGGDNSVLYQPGETYTIPTDFADETLVFMAKWDKGDFTITYKAGDHATGDDIVKNVKGGSNALLEQADVTFTADDGYYFMGWKKEGDVENKLYYAGDNYTLGENTIFVAQWSRAYGNYDSAYTSQIGLYLDMGTGYLYIPGEAEDGSLDVMVDLTFTLNGTAIEITLKDQTPVAGTFDNNGLAIVLTYNKITYTFEAQAVQEPTEPTVTFDANGGSGDAPTATIEYNSTSEVYKITMPTNTFTAPAGKEFKCWSINGNERKEGKSYMAMPGEEVTITAIWQDAQQEPVFEGTVFVGNCTTPAKGLLGGGETYVKLIVSTDKTKVQYTLSNGTVKEANLTVESSTYKPDKYGADAFYYSVKMENVTYYLLVKADMSALSICDNNEELLENGEFLVEITE